MLGLTITQFCRVEHTPHPSTVLGYFLVSVPLASACYIIAILTALVGCWRFVKWQNEMVRGNAVAGGWEMLATWILVFWVSQNLNRQSYKTLTALPQLTLACFVLATAIDILKSY